MLLSFYLLNFYLILIIEIMKCLRSFYKFSTKVVKMDIESVLAGGVAKSKESKYNLL